MNKKTIHDLDITGKRVLLRADLNVPFHRGTSTIADDSRIRAVLPTIRYLLQQNASIILCSHLGRPGGQVSDELRLAPIAQRLSELLGWQVIQTHDCVGIEVEIASSVLKPREILLLEK